MMIEKSGTIRLRDIPTTTRLTQEEQELAAGMVRVTHLYRSALKVAVTQMEILDEEFARLYDHSPIHHIEYRHQDAGQHYRQAAPAGAGGQHRQYLRPHTGRGRHPGHLQLSG